MKHALKAIVPLVLILVLAAPLAADEVTDAVKEGLAAYESKSYGEAASSLEYAVALIRQLKGEKIGTVFPAAPAGWTRGEVESASMGAAAMGGGISARCDYEQDGGDGTMSIEILSDSPFIGALTMALSNPMLLTADGGKLVKFSGNKGRLKLDGDAGEIQVVVDGQILVNLNGRSLPGKDALKDLAEALDWAALEAIAEEN